jgi:hypothetical protein
MMELISAFFVSNLVLLFYKMKRQLIDYRESIEEDAV